MADIVGMTVLHPGSLKATDRLAELCRIDRDCKVLDIACGKGTSAIYLVRKYGCQVVGIDIADHLIAQASDLARKKGLERRASFRVADALDLPYSVGKFDATFSQAILVLVGDNVRKRKAIEEAVRVTRPGGHLGWLELSWKKQPPEEFFEKAVSEIYAACMVNVLTFEGWKKLFADAGLEELETVTLDMRFGDMTGMLADEGLVNTARVALKWLTNSRIRKRMRSIDRFFKDNSEYFGYGLYVGRK